MKKYKAPEYFKTNQKKIWEDTLNKIREVDLFKEGDLGVIETYCVQVSIFQDAMKQVNETGVTFKYTNQAGIANVVKNPALAVAEKASEQILKYANSLGLTPAAWKRLDIKKAEDESDEL